MKKKKKSTTTIQSWSCAGWVVCVWHWQRTELGIKEVMDAQDSLSTCYHHWRWNLSHLLSCRERQADQHQISRSIWHLPLWEMADMGVGGRKQKEKKMDIITHGWLSGWSIVCVVNAAGLFFLVLGSNPSGSTGFYSLYSLSRSMRRLSVQY